MNDRCSGLGCVCAALATLSVAGCAAAPHDLEWTIEFATPALATRATTVHAAILEGGCGGTETYAVELRSGGTMSPLPPRLAPGSWGFYATASDATCTSFASGCEVVTLPATSVHLVLEAATESADCPAVECVAGACRSDAGTSDAATDDVGAHDGGSEDGGSEDAATDDAASEPDACTPAEALCANAADDDCDGTIDCADTDCVATTTCDACVGVTCATCQSCTAGTCGPSTGACPGGRCNAGACCTGCVSATACAAGNTAAACGSGGTACDVCGPCETCTGNACVPRADGVACTNGTGTAGICDAGACCTGCIDGTGRCVSGISMSACGIGGGACIGCTECNRCTSGACIPSGTFCGSGRCHGGSCCTGVDRCWNGTACIVGTTLAACGGEGQNCDACSATEGCCQLSPISAWDCRASCL